PAVGNHDTPSSGRNADTSSFQRYFSLPDAGTYYGLDYGPAHLLVLSSEDVDAFSDDGGDQYLFAQADLAKVTAPWVFATWHVPPYNVGRRHYGEQGDYRDITGLFDGVVDWYFGGHEHLYQRLVPIQYNADLVSEYGNGTDQGVGYMILPPAGNYPEKGIVASDSTYSHYRERLAYPPVEEDSSYVESEIGFVTVEISGQTITLKSWGMGDFFTNITPWVRDEVSYSK
ncbi:MAG: hypothetical protein HN348_34100, partial [Proteobacteria bacterium]|nr:hypothetical protein [Pseudomonadota bacterium]